MNRSQLPSWPTSTYVSLRWKFVYVSVPKAACTSIKWLIAEVQDEDATVFHRSASSQTSRTATIHRRQLWRRTPMLHDLDDAQLAEISPDNGWFVFATTRHPTARLWSGWQSKFLLREPLFVADYEKEPWYPPLPSTTDDVVEGFSRFVAAIAADPKQKIMKDRHFIAQERLLRSKRMTYSATYDTAEIPAMLSDWTAHLTAQGWSGTLDPIRTNETPLEPVRRALSEPVMAAIDTIYGRDFRAFGYADPLPRRVRDDDYPDIVFPPIAMIAERAERVGDLSLLTQAARGNLRRRTVPVRAKPTRLHRAYRKTRRRLRRLRRRLGR